MNRLWNFLKNLQKPNFKKVDFLKIKLTEEKVKYWFWKGKFSSLLKVDRNIVSNLSWNMWILKSFKKIFQTLPKILSEAVSQYCGDISGNVTCGSVSFCCIESFHQCCNIPLISAIG